VSGFVAESPLSVAESCDKEAHAPAPAAQPAASPPHLADSIVCAAAEALDASPRTMRPALRAALERMVALGMTAGEVLAAMAPAVRPANAPKGRQRD
jgi:hypothetical protein